MANPEKQTINDTNEASKEVKPLPERKEMQTLLDPLFADDQDAQREIVPALLRLSDEGNKEPRASNIASVINMALSKYAQDHELDPGAMATLWERAEKVVDVLLKDEPDLAAKVKSILMPPIKAQPAEEERRAA